MSIELGYADPVIDLPRENKSRRAAPGALRVFEYFSQTARDYQSRTACFPWAWLRAREMKEVGRLLGDVSGRDVLELGAGAGFYTRDLIRRGARHVWAIDITAEMLATLPQGPITPVLGDAETVRLKRTFPILLSTGMLEFVRDPAATLANAALLADPNARFVLLVPRANMPVFSIGAFIGATASTFIYSAAPGSKPWHHAPGGWFVA